MIEKLDPIKHTDNLYDRNGFMANVACGGVVIRKINELVDAVNELHEEAENNARIRADHEHKIENLQKDYDNVCIWVGEQKLKAPADPYAEQRKWIGKLCRFWDNLNTDYSLAILVKIIEKEPMPFEDYRGNQWYHCEPVKQDDDIIYKGEQ